MSRASCTISFKSFTRNSAGYKAVMSSKDAASLCDSYAASVAAKANASAKRGVYSTVPATVSGDRVTALVKTSDYEAMIDESRRGTLSRQVT